MSEKFKPRWRKSSFSQPNDDCVELAVLEDGSVGMRDSKAGDEGPVLTFTPSVVQAFIARVKAHNFDHLT